MCAGALVAGYFGRSRADIDRKNMDKIFLEELKIDTIIGIWDWERKIRQTVIIDLEMSADIAKAAATDDVADTLNYKSVAKRIRQFVGDSSFQLVETLAERIAAIIRDEFGVAWVRVKVHKPGAIRGSKDVGIEIVRGQASE
jgi:dihydroneopterin aldolase